MSNRGFELPFSRVSHSAPGEGRWRVCGAFFAKGLQIQLLGERHIEHGDRKTLVEFLQPDDSAVGEAEGVAISVSGGGELVKVTVLSARTFRARCSHGESRKFQPSSPGMQQHIRGRFAAG